MNSRAILVDAFRTPIGKHGGVLSGVRPDDLLAHLLRTMKTRHPALDPLSISDVIAGCANQSGEDSRNVARMAILLADYPLEVPGQTVNRLCGSSMQAAITAAAFIQGGLGDIYLAGGVESMSRAPYAMPKSDKAFPFGEVRVYDTALGWRFFNPKMEPRVRQLSMGETAEEIFAKMPIAREEQDRFAYQSHQRALKAQAEDKFRNEIIPIELPARKGPPTVVSKDEGPRAETTMEILAKLSPAFRKGGSVTAGNSCPMNDGASLTLIMSEARAKAAGYKSGYRFISMGVSALHPDIMGLGPVEASRKALHAAGLTLKDIGLFEINEAFAVQALACVRELGIDESILNVNGGAIAIGHPLGASGTRIIGALTHEMGRRDVRYGLASMCIGVGQGIASIWEKVTL